MGLNCTNPGGCRFPRGGMCLASCSFTSGPAPEMPLGGPATLVVAAPDPGAMWDRVIAYHARRVGIEPAKLVNLIGGVNGLRQDFLDAQDARGVPACGLAQPSEASDA
jgi:hypothetical protein